MFLADFDEFSPPRWGRTSEIHVIVFGIMAIAGLAANFGKGIVFVVGLILLPIVFYPIRAFGSAQYQAAQA